MIFLETRWLRLINKLKKGLFFFSTPPFAATESPLQQPAHEGPSRSLFTRRQRQLQTSTVQQERPDAQSVQRVKHFHVTHKWPKAGERKKEMQEVWAANWPDSIELCSHGEKNNGGNNRGEALRRRSPRESGDKRICGSHFVSLLPDLRFPQEASSSTADCICLLFFVP